MRWCHVRWCERKSVLGGWGVRTKCVDKLTQGSLQGLLFRLFGLLSRCHDCGFSRWLENEDKSDAERSRRRRSKRKRARCRSRGIPGTNANLSEVESKIDVESVEWAGKID